MQFHGRYIQVKDNEIVDSGSLKGDCVRYIQVTAINAGQLNSKYGDDDFWEAVPKLKFRLRFFYKIDRILCMHTLIDQKPMFYLSIKHRKSMACFIVF